MKAVACLMGLVACVLAGCAAPGSPACAAGETRSVDDTLYFGTSRTAAEPVNDAEWAAFLAAEVTPRFPQGLTTWPARGQWQGADGVVLREASHVLSIVHAPDATSEAAVQALSAAYKARFSQEAVLRVRREACVSF